MPISLQAIMWVITNTAIGAGFLSVAAALALNCRRYGDMFWGRLLLIPALLCLAMGMDFFIGAAVAAGMHFPLVAQTVGVVTAAFAIVFGVLIWPLLQHTQIFDNSRLLEQSQSELASSKQLFDAFLNNTPALVAAKHLARRNIS